MVSRICNREELETFDDLYRRRVLIRGKVNLLFKQPISKLIIVKFKSPFSVIIHFDCYVYLEQKQFETLLNK